MNENNIFNSYTSYGVKVSELQLATITLGQALYSVKDGTFKSKIENFRQLQEPEKKLIKETGLDYFVFAKLKNDIRKDEYFISTKIFHFDLDHLTEEKLFELKQQFNNDELILFAFVSPSGNGLKFGCELDTEITSDRQFKSTYRKVKEYFEMKYKIKLDNIGNSSRACYVSYDPEIIIHENNIAFPLSTLKVEEYSPATEIVACEASNNQFDNREKYSNNKLTSAAEYLKNVRLDYPTWNSICFALCCIGTEGIKYFKIISDNDFYNDTSDNLEIKFKSNLKYYTEGKIGLSYVYSTAKKNGWVWDKRTDKENEIIVIEDYIKRFNISRNEISNRLVCSDEDLTDRRVNTLYKDLRKTSPVSRADFDCVLYSDFIPSFNPLKIYFDSLPRFKTTIDDSVLIDKIIESMNVKDAIFAKHFISKWLCSVVASVYGKHSPLCLVLVGEVQGTGKSEWFRRLFPKKLKEYYSENKLDTTEKDIYLLMSNKLVIMDDEFGGKSKLESKIFKELTSKESFDFRCVYGRNIEHFQRLSVLCGTTNDIALLNDVSGNRRILPIYIPGQMNYEMYNSVDKKALWTEVYNLYSNGFQYELTPEDINYLNNNTKDFEEISMEKELFIKHFRKVSEEKDRSKVRYLGTSEILAFLESRYNRRLAIRRLGAEIRKLGFVPKSVRIGNDVLKKYEVIQIDELDSNCTLKELFK